MELEGGLGHLGLRLLEAVSTFLGTSISHFLTFNGLYFYLCDMVIPRHILLSVGSRKDLKFWML